MTYYYDKGFNLCYEPRLMISMTSAERAEYAERRAYMPCLDCCAPADLNLNRCGGCSARFYWNGEPEMYETIHDTEPTYQYLELMRMNDYVQQNLKRFARRVRDLHQGVEREQLQRWHAK